MYEKNVEIGYLLDFYGELLSDRRRDALDMYYNSDMSLSEISEDLGITRQGARDLIKKAGDELLNLEEKLGMARRFRAIEEATAKADAIAAAMGPAGSSIREILSEIKTTINS